MPRQLELKKKKKCEEYDEKKISGHKLKKEKSHI